MQTQDEQHDLPADHRPYTDKYFMRTREILEAEDINPVVELKIFTRGEGRIPDTGLQEATAIINEYSDLETNDGALWVTDEDTFSTKDPLMILRGRAQDVVELETMYLGALSHHLSRANEVPEPDYDAIRDRVDGLTDIYDEVDAPFIYFGARHYHWSKDTEIAKAALDGGAIQTSTDIGSSNIGEDGVGTTPHFLTLVLAHEYGRDEATRMTAERFDEHMSEDIPRVTLVDTFNHEIQDALAVCAAMEDRYGDDWQHSFRVDTCGENVAEGAIPYEEDAAPYETGTGVRISGVKALRDALIADGYGDNTDIFLSSGFGNEEKARAFVDAHKEYTQETGYDLFAGVGAGALTDGIFCTADIYAADGDPLAKTGREVDPAVMETYKQEHMTRVI